MEKVKHLDILYKEWNEILSRLNNNSKKQSIIGLIVGRFGVLVIFGRCEISKQ